MNAKQVYLKNGKPVENGWYCSECKFVIGPQDIAESHCRCIYCREVIKRETVGKGNYSRYHGECWREDQRNRELARIEKAEKLETFDGPVQWDGISGDWGDGFCESVESFAEHWDDRDCDEASRPEFVWTCEPSKVAQIDLDSVLESVCDDMDEGAPDRLSGVDELLAAVKIFNEKNKDVISYTPDYKRMVRVPWHAETAEAR
jgi:hypothetical protein